MLDALQEQASPAAERGRTSSDGAGAAATAVPAPPRRHRPRRAPAAGPGRTGVRPLAALLWLGPALILIAAVVVYPAIELVRASLSRLLHHRSASRGRRAWRTTAKVLAHPDLGTVLVNTVVWVVAVRGADHAVISLGLAQFLGKEFFGRKLVRWAVIIPWAASLVITARLFTLLLDYYYGIVNRFLVAVVLATRRSTSSATTAGRCPR